MSDELKPCPFCGSDHIVESVGTKAGGEPWPYIECFGCSASAEPDVWNRRAIERRTLERAAAACDERAKAARVFCKARNLPDYIAVEAEGLGRTIRALATK